MNDLSPIVLFVYNRPEHTKRTIESLSKNNLSSESFLYVYSDAPKDLKDQASVDQVRHYLHSINPTYFKKILVTERENNLGLANSIISGVSEVVHKHGKVIVLEDDIVTGKSFLTFMNSALDFYYDKKKVWHVSGWNYPIEHKGLSDVFIWRGMECWGWATWADRWKNFNNNIEYTVGSFSKKDISFLNLDNSRNVWRQVIENRAGKIDTWAIFWFTTISKNKGMSVNITRSLTQNIGIDGTGHNCDDDDIYRLDDSAYLEQEMDFEFEEDLEESKLAVERIKAFYKHSRGSIAKRIVRKLKKIISIYFS